MKYLVFDCIAKIKYIYLMFNALQCLQVFMSLYLVWNTNMFVVESKKISLLKADRIDYTDLLNRN